MADSFWILSLIVHINLFIINSACQFKIYDYADTDNYAANNGWTRLTYANLQTTGAYKTSLIDFLNANSLRIQALSTFNAGNACMSYGESEFIVWTSTSFLGASSTTSCSYGGNYVQNNWYYLCDYQTRITSMSYSNNFNRKTSCTNSKNAAFYRKCPTTPAPTPAPTTNPIPAPTPAPTTNPIPAPTNNPTPTPTSNPTPAPTFLPTPAPTNNPTPSPTVNPTLTPSSAPTKNPTPTPTYNPTPFPTNNPTKIPTISPTIITLNPSKNPTKNPTLNPSVNPSKNPTLTPTFPEGAVDSDNSDDDTDGNEDSNNQGDDKMQASSGSILDGNMMIYIIIGVGGLLAICCIIFGTFFYKKRKKKGLDTKHRVNSHMEGANGGTNVTNTSHGMIQLGSVSPRSVNSIQFNAMSVDHETAGVDEGADMDIIAMDGDDDDDDGDNDLFGVTGATAGGYTAGGDNEDIQFPELPDNNESDKESISDEQNDNELYKRQTIRGGVDLEMYEKPEEILNEECKLCDQCGESVGVDNGKSDDNDGNWYCNKCWESFYE